MKALKEYFSVGERPVVNVRPGPGVVPTTRWKHIHDVGLTKTYVFDTRALRDRFIIQCIALETHRGKEDVAWTIEGSAVSVLLKAPPIGLTEPIVEFAKTLDELRRDLDYIATDDDAEAYG